MSIVDAFGDLQTPVQDFAYDFEASENLNETAEKTPFQHLEFSKSETCSGLPKQVNLSSRMIMNVIKVANDVIESTAAFNLTQAGPDVKETETANELEKIMNVKQIMNLMIKL
jgi:hypothetical protein